jgi:hypothetical protein
MLRHTGFGLQGCLLFSTQRGGAIGHPGLGVRRTGPDTDKARKTACSRVRTAADEGGSGGGGSSVVFRLSWRRRLSFAATAVATAFLAPAPTAFLAPGGLASVVLLVSGAGPASVLVILAAGAGVAGVAGFAVPQG